MMMNSEGSLISPSSMLHNKLVVVVGDSVPDEDTTVDELAGALFNKLSKIMPASIEGIVCASGVANEVNTGLLGTLFGDSGISFLA